MVKEDNINRTIQLHPFLAQSILPQSRIGNVYCIGPLHFIVGALRGQGLGVQFSSSQSQHSPLTGGYPLGGVTPYTEAGSGTLDR
jgi:hypothetical protein